MKPFKEYLNFSLFDLKHKIGAAVFLFIAIVGIPITVLTVQQFQDPRSRAQESKPTLQIGTFTPETYEDEVKAPHEVGEIIVKYAATLSITTRPEVNQDTQAFTVDDIISGLPEKDIYNLRVTQVLKIEKVFKNINPGQRKDRKVTNSLINIYKLTISNAVKLEEAMQKICNSELVLYCEPNYKLAPAFLFPDFLSTPKVFAECIGDNCDQAIELPEPKSRNSRKVTVAIVDAPLPPEISPFDYFLNNLAGVIDFDSPREDYGRNHAYEVAKTALSVNPNVDIMFVGVCGITCSSEKIAEGIVAAVNNGADVINISLGAASYDGNFPQTLADAINYAQSNGVIVVAASGNSSRHQGGSSISSINHYPSGIPGVISVGALDQDNKIANYSNVGARNDVVACGCFADGSPNGGTSNASPRVAAVVAAILDANPSLTPIQVLDIIKLSSEDLGVPGKDNTYGSGKVNVDAAVNLAINYDPRNVPPDLLKDIRKWAENNIPDFGSIQAGPQGQIRILDKEGNDITPIRESLDIPSSALYNQWDENSGKWISPESNIFDPVAKIWVSPDGKNTYDPSKGDVWISPEDNYYDADEGLWHSPDGKNTFNPDEGKWRDPGGNTFDPNEGFWRTPDGTIIYDENSPTQGATQDGGSIFDKISNAANSVVDTVGGFFGLGGGEKNKNKITPPSVGDAGLRDPGIPTDEYGNKWDEGSGVWVSPEGNTFDPNVGVWVSQDGSMTYDDASGTWNPIEQGGGGIIETTQDTVRSVGKFIGGIFGGGNQITPPNTEDAGLADPSVSTDEHGNKWDEGSGVWVSPEGNTFDPDEGVWHSADGNMIYDESSGTWSSAPQDSVSIIDTVQNVVETVSDFIGDIF